MGLESSEKICKGTLKSAFFSEVHRNESLFLNR